MRVHDALDSRLVRLAIAAGVVAMILLGMSLSAKADCLPDNNGHTVCGVASSHRMAPRHAHKSPRGRAAAHSRQHRAPVLDANANRAEIIGGRPAGCPHAYCGCGLRKYLGIADTRLNLAWNWTKYYRGGRSIAVWHHHVALIEQMVGPRTALLRDFNSGGGLSRLHVRSIAGAVIVNGNGKMAGLQ